MCAEPAATSDVTTACPRLPRYSVCADGPTSATSAPAERSASSGPVNSRSSNPSSTRIAIRLPVKDPRSAINIPPGADCNSSFLDIPRRYNRVMPNRLTNERSPYLLQHANNPVDWFAWGDEAFGKARAEDKPIFLSIGYSTCHWCHVMEHESFESPEVAAVLNEHFVSIKVDREERPDVDRVYMTFVQATTQSGGWPMSVWLTPDLKPFYGGTYFPPTSRWGRPGFIDILREIARLWRAERGRVSSSADAMTEQLRSMERSTPAWTVPGAAALTRTVQQFGTAFDRRYGGFGDAPKFPRPCELLFLLREHARELAGGAGQTVSPALEMVLQTLRAMALG